MRTAGQMYTGILVDAYKVTESEIWIDDIAHHLSMQCRYLGATKYFYSVAEHSVLASHHVPSEFALEALLHDGLETYFGDCTAPNKRNRDHYTVAREVAEDRCQTLIRNRFGITQTLESSSAVDAVDKRLVFDEAAELLNNQAPYVDYGPTLGAEILGYSAINAETMFLLRFLQLTSNKEAAPWWYRWPNGRPWNGNAC